MRSVLYPGSFDPFTRGHLDLVIRACELFDRVVVGVAVNSKKHPMFSLEERKELIEKSLLDAHTPILDKVEVDVLDGLIVEHINSLKVDCIIRGIRAFSDFEHEMQMAEMNRDMYPGCETIFMIPELRLSFISSSAVKEIALRGGDISPYVPESVAAAVKEKFHECV